MDFIATAVGFQVPPSLPMALDALEADEVMKQALGVQFCGGSGNLHQNCTSGGSYLKDCLRAAASWYLKLKRDECAEFPDEAVPLAGDDEAAKAERVRGLRNDEFPLKSDEILLKSDNFRSEKR